MHNIMAAGLRDRPYTLSTVVILAVPETENSLTVPEHTTAETLLNMSPEIKAHFKSEKEAIHLILTGIGDEIYSIVDACKTAHEMYMNDNQTGQFRNQRTVNVVGARKNECKKPKRVKDFMYHKENMLLCKQYEKGVPRVEQSNWLADTDEEIDEQELEAHYSYMAKIQEVPTADSCTNYEPLEQVQYDAGYNVFANEIQHSEQSESISNTCVVETDDSNVIPDLPNMCDNDIQMTKML
nr:hypothetical protein [Tanacetum cinerariifolium]